MTPEELKRLAEAALRAKKIAAIYMSYVERSQTASITLEQSNKMLAEALARKGAHGD